MQDMGYIASQMMPFLILVVGMWLLFIRPRQKEMKAMQEMQKQLSKGDRVLTQAGFYGEIDQLKDESVVIRVDGARIEMTRNSIIRKIEDKA
jgi:preprotein translocase subunit YajC